MLTSLLGLQIKVFDDLQRGLEKEADFLPGPDNPIYVVTRDNLISQHRMLDEMKNEVDSTRILVIRYHLFIDGIMTDCFQKHLGLLDLKQKSATLSEARSTAQQGRAVMLFTIVTVIFVSTSNSPTKTGWSLLITGHSSLCPSSHLTSDKMYLKSPATIRIHPRGTCGK